MKRSVGAIFMALMLLFALPVAGCSDPGQQEERRLSVSQSSYTYEGEDLAVTIENLGYAVLQSVRNGDAALASSDYSAQEDVLTLKNAYLSTLDEGRYDFTVTADIGSVAFQVTVPEEAPQVGLPAVTPASVDLDIAQIGDGLDFTVDYNGGALQSITLNGNALTVSDYSVSPSGITLAGDYLRSLGAGSFVFTFTTDGGSCTFTVNLAYSSLQSDTPYASFTGSDITLDLNGAAGQTLEYFLNGAKMDSSFFTVGNDTLTVDADVFSSLKKDIYTLEVSAGAGNSILFTILGDVGSYFYCDYDAFPQPGLGYGQDLTVSVAEGAGVRGNGGRVVNNGQGTFLIFDEENIPFNFVAGTTYALSFDMKVNSVTAETSSFMDIAFPFVIKSDAGNADIGYIYYTEADGWYFNSDSAGKYVSIAETDFGYRVYLEFEWKEGYNRLEIADWMQSDIVFDNIKLIPADGRMDMSVARTDYVEYGSDAALVKNFGDVNILGVRLGDAWADETQVSTEGGILTFTAAYLQTLEKGSTVEYTVYTDKGDFSGTLSVQAYDISLTGDFHYTGEDLTFTLNSSGLALRGITLGGTAAGADEYSLTGDTLVLKSSLLERVQGSAELVLNFDQGQSRSYTITSSTLFRIDFDSFGAPSSGFAEGAASEIVSDGINGNSAKVTVTSSATLIAAGQVFIPVNFEAGKTYEFRMDFRMESIDGDTNFAIPNSQVFMPMSFGSGKDVLYLNYADGAFTASAQSFGGDASVVEKDGVYTLSVDINVAEGMTRLSFDIWMPCVMIVDNIVLTEATA